MFSSCRGYQQDGLMQNTIDLTSASFTVNIIIGRNGVEQVQYFVIWSIELF